MKKLVLHVLTVALGAVAIAGPVDQATAHKVAVNYWNSARPQHVREVRAMQLLPVAELEHQYVFAAGQTGFVIVSADDCVPPVVGFSFDSPATEQLNPEVRFWLQSYDAQIAAWEGVQGPVHSMWEPLLGGGEIPVPLTSSNITPLCSTRWDQGEPFNTYCPWDTVENDRAVVGCVATAMAQIMKRWNHPSCGTGSHEYQHFFLDDLDYDYGTLSANFGNTTYLWEDMPDKAGIGASAKTAKAVGTLSYHCGVAVEMMYGTISMGGSAAYSSCGGWASGCAEMAFSQYFKYSPDLVYRTRNSYEWDNGGWKEVFLYSDSAWQAMIDTEIEAGRPIYYDGSDYSGGHAFVLDGRFDGKYHFNWGWSGSYDGYYLLSNIAPGAGGVGGNATYSFNNNQGAIFGIVPLPETFDTVYVSDSICEMKTPYEFYEYTLPSQSVDTMLRHLDTLFVLSLDAALSSSAMFNPNNGSLEGQVEIEYCRFDGLVMPECTFEKPGKNFGGWSQKKKGDAPIYQPGDTAWVSGNITFYARWKDTSQVSIVDVESDELTIWPNPMADVMHVQVPEEGGAQLYIVDAVGRMAKCVKLTSSKAEISLEGLPAGLYLVRVATASAVYNKRIVKH